MWAIPRRCTWIVVAGALGLGGCADYGGPISGQSATALSPQERRLQEVETKTAQLLRRLDAMNSGQTSQNLTRIEEDVRNLRGETEKLRFELEKRERSNKELFGNLDQRLARLESGAADSSSSVSDASFGSNASGTAPVPTSTPGTLSASSGLQKASVATPEEERAYLGTFDLLKNGDYDGAISGFGEMLSQWPQGRYADNGWYWMGEAQLVKRDYADAAKSFESLIRSFPSSPKVADGLYKLGLCQAELKRPSEAKISLQRVIRDYPDSNAANLAKRKLDQLGG